MAKIHPDDTKNAFWALGKCLGELIFWAKNPLPQNTSSDGWREAFRIDIRDKGDRARDVAPDDATRNQVTSSRSLAAELIRLLNSCPELNCTPCPNWSHTDQKTVNQLADLQELFARIGDGERPKPPGTQPTNGAVREYSPWIGAPEMIVLMKSNGIRGTVERTITRKKQDWQAESQAGTNNRLIRFKLSTRSELGIKYPPAWDEHEG